MWLLEDKINSYIFLSYFSKDIQVLLPHHLQHLSQQLLEAFCGKLLHCHHRSIFDMD
jgi:hypothetical protein